MSDQLWQREKHQLQLKLIELENEVDMKNNELEHCHRMLEHGNHIVVNVYIDELRLYWDIIILIYYLHLFPACIWYLFKGNVIWYIVCTLMK